VKLKVLPSWPPLRMLGEEAKNGSPFLMTVAVPTPLPMSIVCQRA